jgi:hypothetical protein
MAEDKRTWTSVAGQALITTGEFVTTYIQETPAVGPRWSAHISGRCRSCETILWTFDEPHCGKCGSSDLVSEGGLPLKGEKYWRRMYNASLDNFVAKNILERQREPHEFVPQSGHDADICEHCDDVASSVYHEVFELRKRVAALEATTEADCAVDPAAGRGQEDDTRDRKALSDD